MKALTGTATVYDVARHAKVSIATVSRALNSSSLVATDTRDRILEAVDALGYEPNRAARSLVTRSTKTIGLLLPDITNPFFPELVKGAQLLAAERAYALLLSQTGGLARMEQQYLDIFRGKGVDGLLVVGLALGRARLSRFSASGIPMVSLDRDVHLPDVPQVHLDNRAGARRATDHLLSLGHSRVAHIGGPSILEVSQDRARGYRDALEAAGITPSADLFVEGDFTEEGGRAALRTLEQRGRRLTAVFVANDLMAIGALAAAKDLGLRVPADLSIVGFDGISLAAYTTPRLTTLRQPTYEMGRRAAQMLLDMIGGKTPASIERQVVFQGELVRGESAGPPANS